MGGILANVLDSRPDRGQAKVNTIANGKREDEPVAVPTQRTGYLGAGVVYAFLLAASGLVLYPALRDSLAWRLSHDTPFMLYMGYIVERFGMIPYRDFFDVNMLGSYLSYQWIGRVFGFTDAGLHRADLALLGVLTLIVGLMLWRLGLRCVWAAMLLFALLYLRDGPTMTLQRDYLALFPATLGVALATGLPWFHAQWRAFFSGICFAAAAAIKPHMAIGLLPVVIYLASDQALPEDGFKARARLFFWCSVQAGLGGALVVLAYVGYLVYYGALGHFLDSALAYVPLYAEMTGKHELLPAEARRMYVLDGFLNFGGRWSTLLLGFIGLGAGFANTRLSSSAARIVSLLAMLVVAYAVYPAITGQFWNYHYLPLVLFLSLAGGMAFMPYAHDTPWQKVWIPIVMVLVVCAHLFQPHRDFRSLQGIHSQGPKLARVDAIASYLKENLRPGDTVQPLDWVDGGMLHAMLYADARPATEFLCYFHFFHHIDTPYIQDLRKRFMVSLDRAKPRFVIEWIPNTAGWVRPGPRVAKDFPEVEAYLAEHYDQSQKGREYVIHERKPAMEVAP